MITPQAGKQYADHEAGFAAAARIAAAAMRFAQVAHPAAFWFLPLQHALDDDAGGVEAIGVGQRVGQGAEVNQDASRLRARLLKS